MKKELLLTLIVAMAAFSAHSVPAMRGLRPVVQADGTTVMIQRVGDERIHFDLDSEGALLHCVDGQYRLAQLCPDGSLVDSPVAVMWDSEPVQTTVARLCDRVESASGFSALRSAGIGLIPDRTFPAKGEQKAIVILVEYSDVAFTHPEPYKYFNDMLTKDGFSDPDYGVTGSCRDYFI
ncbi:MAG: hypothetical protein K2N76_06470, partial [Muribaculaceae bacterium]|nr:hypothetical protein [Muribaculaceae bacterium]